RRATFRRRRRSSCSTRAAVPADLREPAIGTPVPPLNGPSLSVRNEEQRPFHTVPYKSPQTASPLVLVRAGTRRYPVPSSGGLVEPPHRRIGLITRYSGCVSTDSNTHETG